MEDRMGIWTRKSPIQSSNGASKFAVHMRHAYTGDFRWKFLPLVLHLLNLVMQTGSDRDIIWGRAEEIGCQRMLFLFSASRAEGKTRLYDKVPQGYWHASCCAARRLLPHGRLVSIGSVSETISIRINFVNAYNDCNILIDYREQSRSGEWKGCAKGLSFHQVDDQTRGIAGHSTVCVLQSRA